jgi:NitT/TauT family transport system substrate-binding protein
MSKYRLWTVLVGIVAVSLVVALVSFLRSPDATPHPPPVAPANPPEALRKVVVNEAVRTLVYIPIYYALERGYFRAAGLDVEIITGGTAANAFAAMSSGEAQFAVADPMFVPISREQGAKTKVVSQVVARIAVWALTMRPEPASWLANEVKGTKVSTQIRPMTAYVYAAKAVSELGLDPEKDVELIQNKPPTEIAPLLNGQADFAFTLEPNATLAESQGARIVLSYPELLGDQVFTGLMAREDYLAANPAESRAFVEALQRAMTELHANPTAALPAAQRFFPQLDPKIVETALARLVRERVIPASVEIPEESWNRAIAVRVKAGDLKVPMTRAEACTVELMKSAAATSKEST